ncbi:transposase, partial [Escherichia coli]|nr:transposase [Escherichia coli]
RDQQWHPHIHLSTTTGGVTSDHTWKNLHFYARKVMSMWRYRITRLLSRKYPELLIPDALAAERNSKREWNRFLDTHYRRGWNVNVSQVIISHNLKQLRSLFTRKFHPFSSTQVAEEPLLHRS